MDFTALSAILKEKPEILDNRTRLSDLLKDLFPENRKEINLLLSAYDAGAVLEIQQHELDDTLRNRLSDILTDDYAMDKKYAEQATESWIDFYGIGVLEKESCLTKPQTTDEKTSAPRHIPKAASTRNTATTLTLGFKEDRTELSVDLCDIPHMLICGTTGSGKTSFVRSVFSSLAQRCSPSKIRFIMIDSKVIDYADFNGIPQMLIPVITDSKKAIAAVNWLQVEMEHRLNRLSSMNTNSYLKYNQIVEPDETGMPDLFCVIDDCSILFTEPSFQEILPTLLQNGRIVGIHLWLITSSIMPLRGAIRQHLLSLQNRIVFHLSMVSESKSLVGRSGAEKLPVPGAFLYWQYGTPLLCQAIYHEDEEIRIVLKNLSRDTVAHDPQSLENTEVLDQNDYNEKSTISDACDFGDEMFVKAVELAIDAGQVSISMLQRRLRIGYARAGRLVDEMTELGITSETEGPTKPRKVLISRDDFRRLLNSEVLSASLPSDDKQRKEPTMEPIAQPVIPNTPLQPLQKHPATENSSFEKQSDASPASLQSDDEQKEIQPTEPIAGPVKPNIHLRPFPKYLTAENNSFEIQADQIQLIVNKSSSSGTSVIRFTGQIINELKYKKPHLFSIGYIEFVFKQTAKALNNQSQPIPVSSNNIIRIPLKGKDRKQAEQFLMQLSEDTGVKITSL